MTMASSGGTLMSCSAYQLTASLVQSNARTLIGCQLETLLSHTHVLCKVKFADLCAASTLLLIGIEWSLHNGFRYLMYIQGDDVVLPVLSNDDMNLTRHSLNPTAGSTLQKVDPYRQTKAYAINGLIFSDQSDTVVCFCLLRG